MNKVKRFSIEKFVEWMFEHYKDKPDSLKQQLASYIASEDTWVRQCKDKTKSQMQKMGYACEDAWLE